jgi:hypothetical protein
MISQISLTDLTLPLQLNLIFILVDDELVVWFSCDCSGCQLINVGGVDFFKLTRLKIRFNWSGRVKSVKEICDIIHRY